MYRNVPKCTIAFAFRNTIHFYIVEKYLLIILEWIYRQYFTRNCTFGSLKLLKFFIKFHCSSLWKKYIYFMILDSYVNFAFFSWICVRMVYFIIYIYLNLYIFKFIHFLCYFTYILHIYFNSWLIFPIIPILLLQIQQIKKLNI